MKKRLFLILIKSLFVICLFAQSNIAISKQYFEKARNKSLKGDERGAILDYNKCIELNPKYADAYYGRGFAKYYSNDKNGACLDWSQAGELGYADAYSTIKEKCN